MTTSKASPGVKKQEDLQKRVGAWMTDQSPEVVKQWAFIMSRLNRALLQRNSIKEYFDGLGFVDDFVLNERARNSYLVPKLNDSEIRVVTGMTEKKIETIVDEIMSLNFQPEVMAYDKNDTAYTELGELFTNIVQRTNEIERDDDFWLEAIYEVLCQRAAFIEERYTEKTVGSGKSKTKDCEVRKVLRSGMQVLLGDISIPAYRFNEQPFIANVERFDYSVLEAYWQDNPNWVKVQPGGTTNIYSFDSAYSYRIGKLLDHEVESITYKSYLDNEYQVYLNSVPMFPANEPLPYSYPGYDSTMTVLKPMSNRFAYGRPTTSMAKVLQALSDESIRLMIFKWRQALQPPLGTPAGMKVYSKDIWAPAAVTSGISAKDFEKLVDHDGVTPSEFQMFNLIQQKTEEFTGVSPILQGDVPTNITATQLLSMQKQAIKQLGMAMFAFMRMKRDVTYLRIYNVLENMLDPIDKTLDPISNQVKNVYRKFTILDADLGNGQYGTKHIQFAENDLTPEELSQLKAHEEQQASIGKPVRYFSINVKTLKKIPLWFHVVVNAKERDGSALEQTMFAEKLNQATTVSQITGQQLSGEKVTKEFERTWDAPGWITPAVPNAMPMGGQVDPATGQPVAPAPAGTTPGQGGGQPTSPQDILKRISGMQGSSGAPAAGGLKNAITHAIPQ